MRLITALLLAVATAQVPSGLAAAAPTQTRTIQMGSLQRSYLVHVPRGFPAMGPAGLVVVLHGGGGNGRQIERHTGFSALADREGFIAVYPEALDGNWNDGRSAPGIAAQQQNVDDVRFLTTLITGLTSEFAVDPGRVYVTGASNGAFMSQRLAAEVSGRIAAIASVIGGMAPQVKNRFGPRSPVSVLLMNGTDDPLVPYPPITAALGDRRACCLLTWIPTTAPGCAARPTPNARTGPR